MVHYWYGEDTYGAREAIQNRAATLGARLRFLSRDDVEERPLEQWLAGGGLFGPELLVLSEPARLPLPIQESLVKFAAHSGGVELILWERGVVDRRSKLWRAYGKRGREFLVGDESRVSTWLQQEATARGGSLNREAAQELLRRVGLDRWRLQAELARLLLLQSDVSVELVKAEIIDQVPEDIFRVLEAVTRRDRQAAVQGVEQLLAQGASELYVLSMLAYQFRTLLSVREGLEENLSVEDIARVKRLQPFVIRKQLPRARQVTSEGLLETLTRLLAIDFAIKRGKVEARTGLCMGLLGLVTETVMAAGRRGE